MIMMLSLWATVPVAARQGALVQVTGLVLVVELLRVYAVSGTPLGYPSTPSLRDVR